MFIGKVKTVFGIGTIGSLIVEALIQYEISSIRIFCNNENELWEAEQKYGNVKKDS